MRTQVLTDNEELLIRRLVLEPGEAMPWHCDACRRFTVVVRGEHLTIEFRDNGERVEVPVSPGRADWEQPQSRIHRAINSGRETFEEVVTFYRDRPGQNPQPEAEQDDNLESVNP